MPETDVCRTTTLQDLHAKEGDSCTIVRYMTMIEVEQLEEQCILFNNLTGYTFPSSTPRDKE
jgi:hypothetical protein